MGGIERRRERERGKRKRKRNGKRMRKRYEERMGNVPVTVDFPEWYIIMDKDDMVMMSNTNTSWTQAIHHAVDFRFHTYLFTTCHLVWLLVMYINMTPRSTRHHNHHIHLNPPPSTQSNHIDSHPPQSSFSLPSALSIAANNPSTVPASIICLATSALSSIDARLFVFSTPTLFAIPPLP